MFILDDPKHKKWNRWDIRIANGYHMLKAFEVNGEPVWRDQSPRVSYTVKTRVSRSQAALDRWRHNEEKRARKKGYVPKFGVAPYAVPEVIDGGKMPTKRDWVEAQQGIERPGAPKTLTTGEVVQTVADPQKMADFRRRVAAQRSKRPRAVD